MINKLAELWDTKRWLFWLLCFITIPALFLKYYLDYLEAKADRDLEAANNRDKDLKSKQDAANAAANAEKAKADAAEERIKNRNEDDIDEDWNTKD